MPTKFDGHPSPRSGVILRTDEHTTQTRAADHICSARGAQVENKAVSNRKKRKAVQ